MKKTLSSIQIFPTDRTNLSYIRYVFRSIAIVLGGLHTYAAIKSQSMNADGIAYLDIGDAYFRADWANAINAVWSPMYSWILGLVNFIFKPSMQWEFPFVHIVNFSIFLLALASFEFMWSNAQPEKPAADSCRLTDPQWWTLGYLLFIWTSLNLIQIWAVTPDMLMAVFVFLAAGIIAKIRFGGGSYRVFLVLGLILGFGYLSKTFMFSTALIFLGLAWLVQKKSKDSVARTLVAVCMFLLVSVPFVLIISSKEGKLTIGEAGSVTYLRHVIGIPYPHWQGDIAHNIMPAHPSRVIYETPPVYEFGEPIGGTYPISTDPAYWYEGIDVGIDFRNLITSLFANGMVYLELFFQKQGLLVACVIALYIMGQRTRLTLTEAISRWALVIPALIAFGLYGMVLVASRYIGVFVLLFWVDILANIQLPPMPGNRQWVKVLSGIAAFGLLVSIILFNLEGINRLNPSLGTNLQQSMSAPAKPLAVAQALEELGVEPGDKVGVIGYAYDSFWARLAKVQIIAEMIEVDAVDLWMGDEALQQSVLQAFAGAGTKAVVAEYVPEYAELNAWNRVGNSNYFIYVFTEQEGS